jgi:hypothetical protein
MIRRDAFVEAELFDESIRIVNGLSSPPPAREGTPVGPDRLPRGCDRFYTTSVSRDTEEIFKGSCVHWSAGVRQDGGKAVSQCGLPCKFLEVQPATLALFYWGCLRYHSGKLLRV